jgi:uncharacterized membrane protein
MDKTSRHQNRPQKDPSSGDHPRLLMKLSRLETLGDAVFAFALTLLAFDLKIPEVRPEDLTQNLIAMLPKLAIFIFVFLVIAQQWDGYQRTMRCIDHVDGVYVWLNLLSLMFIVLLPSFAGILARYTLQTSALILFGTNLALFNLISWVQWRYAAGKGKLVIESVDPRAIRMINGLWLIPFFVITLSIPASFINVYPVYVIWLVMPFFSYIISSRTIQNIRERSIKSGTR